MSSFKRRTTSAQLPAGCRISSAYGQVLTSTGVESLDDILGGGVPLGTVLAIHADRGSSSGYAALLLKHFCAQAIYSQQSLLVASADLHPRIIVRSLPCAILLDCLPKTSANNVTSNDDTLNIAWRYKHMRKVTDTPQQQESGAGRYCLSYDISKEIEHTLIDDERIHTLHLVDNGNDNQDQYELLFQEILTVINNGNFRASATLPNNSERRSVLRIAIHAMLSPFWNTSSVYAHLQFLHRLRALLRRSFAVAMITLSSTSTHPRGPIQTLSDFVLALDAFSTSITLPPSILTNPYLSTSAKVNAMGMSQNWAFKVRRKRISIETWHLPPELGDEPSRAQNHDTAIIKKIITPTHALTEEMNAMKLATGSNVGRHPGVGCSSTRPDKINPLDF